MIKVCKEDLNGAKRPESIKDAWWYFNPITEMFFRLSEDGVSERMIAASDIPNPDMIRLKQKREPSRATEAMWEFWQKWKLKGKEAV